MKILAISPYDLYTHLATAGGNYGDRLVVEGVGEFVYAYCGSAVVKGGWYFIGKDGSSDHNPLVSAAATTAIQQEAGVAVAAVATTGGMWFQVKGTCTQAIVDGGTDVAAGDALQMVNAQNYVIKDGGTTLTADTVAFAVTAQTGAVAAQTDSTVNTVYILGRKATIG